MKPSPAFQLYAQDFLVGTADLTAEETGAYIRLLCYQWVKHGLPKDDRKLMQLSGITDAYVLGNVLAKFRLCEDEIYRNDRLESVRLKQDEYRSKQSKNGQKGGNPNFHKGKDNPYHKPKDNPPDIPEINSSPSSSSSVLNTIPESASPTRIFSDLWVAAFHEKFGTKYHFGGAKDMNAIKSLLKSENPDDLILIAKAAWDFQNDFDCKHAVSISSFSSQFNKIRAKVGAVKSSKEWTL